MAETTVQHVTRDDVSVPAFSQKIENFNETLKLWLDDTNFKIQGRGNFALDEDDCNLPQWDPAYGGNTPSKVEYGAEMKTAPLAEVDDLEPEVIDKYIGAKVILDETTNYGDNLATVNRRAMDLEGCGLRTAHRNPMLDTRECKIELEDAKTDCRFANKVGKNIYSQLDDEG